MSEAAPAIVSIGECMIELSMSGDQCRRGYGGDTLNTALYLARLGERVAFMTALGDDPYSAGMRAGWQAEGIDTAMVLTAPGELPGIYTIHADADGERSFHYWRDRSAVRRMPHLPGYADLLAIAGEADILYLTGITLALFGDAERATLMAAIDKVLARGAIFAFDPNYRARLWPSAEAARCVIDAFGGRASILLPSLQDEQLLHGAEISAPKVIARWKARGAGEVVVKLGADGCMLTGGAIVAPDDTPIAIDTTGAGDSFNAGYLAARRQGQSPREAARLANRLAGRVVGQHGAIIDVAAMADLIPVPAHG